MVGVRLDERRDPGDDECRSEECPFHASSASLISSIVAPASRASPSTGT
jgi:hypothetical protein